MRTGPAFSLPLLTLLSSYTVFSMLHFQIKSIDNTEVDVSAGVCKHNRHGKAVMLWEVRVPLAVIATVKSTSLLQSTGHCLLTAIFKAQSESYRRVDLIVSIPFTNA